MRKRRQRSRTCISTAIRRTPRRWCPTRLIDEIALVGSADRIKDRLQAWKQVAQGGKLTTMVLTGASVEAMRVVAEAVL